MAKKVLKKTVKKSKSSKPSVAKKAKKQPAPEQPTTPQIETKREMSPGIIAGALAGVIVWAVLCGILLMAAFGPSLADVMYNPPTGRILVTNDQEIYNNFRDDPFFGGKSMQYREQVSLDTVIGYIPDHVDLIEIGCGENSVFEKTLRTAPSSVKEDVAKVCGEGNWKYVVFYETLPHFSPPGR